jgi:hypothetical protein
MILVPYSMILISVVQKNVCIRSPNIQQCHLGIARRYKTITGLNMILLSKLIILLLSMLMDFVCATPPYSLAVFLLREYFKPDAVYYQACRR